MREIKFEYLFTVEDQEDEEEEDKIKDERQIFTLDEICNNEVDSWLSCCYVSSSKIIAIRQYSGLHDKNDKEIYEGDIIKYKSFDSKEYTQECPALTSFHFWQETEDNDSVEVIGDIYQNPKLIDLKQKENGK